MVRDIRTWARLAVGAAALAFLSPGGPVAGSTSVAGGAATGCDPSGSLSVARVRAGADGVDPNSYSAAEAAALNRRLNQRIHRLRAQGVIGRHLQVAGKSAYQVDTYVHVITRNDGSGGVTQEQVDAQMAVLNAAFKGGRVAAGVYSAGTPFRFVLQGVDYTANDDWYDWHLLPDFSDEDADAKAAKEALHQGSYDDLNIYIAGLGDGLLGYADLAGDGTPLLYDGLVLLNDSLPGGAAAPYNLGDTAPHEIGHWLGLFHTFEGGCVAPGDYVADTPYQADGDNIFFCNESDNTCRQAGRDPVHNYMSYGDDECLDRFTVGQSLRMRRAWLAYRYRR